MPSSIFVSAPREIRRAFYDIHSQLEHISNQMKVATENIKKCMEQLVHEKELVSGNQLTTDLYYQLMTDPATGMRSQHSTMMCYWLGLVNDDPFESSRRE